MRFSLRVKVVAAVLLMALAVAGVTVLVSYNMYARSMDDHYEQLTVNTAKSAASMVDAAAVAELTERTLEIYRGLCPDENTPPDFDSFDEADWAEYFAAFDEIAESLCHPQRPEGGQRRPVALRGLYGRADRPGHLHRGRGLHRRRLPAGHLRRH